MKKEIRTHEIDLALAIEASAEIDKLRKKSSGNWNGAEEIRKWRETRR
ncbi:MAG: hypothetical protein ACTSYB_17465 [Candidatus Helarchaeota archaeon]